MPLVEPRLKYMYTGVAHVKCNMLLHGSVRRQKDFLELITISVQLNSYSQSCSNFSNSVIEGANKRMSSACIRLLIFS